MQKSKVIRKIKRIQNPKRTDKQLVVYKPQKSQNSNMFGGWQPQKVIDFTVPHKIVQKFKQASTLSKLPPIVSVLNTVAVKKGFLPIGVTSVGQSSQYIGRYWDRNAHMMVPFPKQGQKPKATINIGQNFNYYVGKAINKWNQFVNASQQLTQFSNQVNTPSKQQAWTQKKIQQLSWNNQIYKWVTTLFYAYVFPNIPMTSQSDISQIEYKPPKANILCLSLAQMKQIWKIFLKNNKNSVQTVYDQLTLVLTQMMNNAQAHSFNQKYRRLAVYLQLIQIFTENTSFYLAKQGLPPQAIKQILSGGVKIDPSKISNYVKTQLMDYINASQIGGTQSIQTISFRFPLNRQSMQQFPQFNLVGDDQFKSKLKGLFDIQTYGQVLK